MKLAPGGALVLPFLLGLVAALGLPRALAAQPTPPPEVQWFPAAEAKAERTWLPLVDRATLSLGRYRLRTGATDAQAPHDRDEVYCVLAGKAKFTAAGETRDVGPGDAVFVAAHAAHRFHAIEEDLDLMVFFSAARPAHGGMIEGPTPTEQTPYPETSPRGGTRIFYWFGPASAGQVAIDHGQPAWNARYEQFLTKPGGQRWRLGENFWTSLDTNMPLTLGDVDVPIGLYYLVLQNNAERGPELVLLDPDAVRQQTLDAYEASKTSGGIVVPLDRGKAEHPTHRLQIELVVDRSQKDRGVLRVRFGPHELSTSVHMQPRRD